MTTPSEPDTSKESPKESRWRRMRPRGRGAIIGAGVLALLVVGAVGAALLIPGGGPWRGDRHAALAHGGQWGDPDVGLMGEFQDFAGPGDGPVFGPERRGPGPGPRRGERGLGNDTVLVGTVVSTANNTIVVTPDGGAQRTIKTDDRTRVRGSGNNRLGDLQAGERVVIRVDGSGDAATAVSVLSPMARVAGTVTAISGDTATITAVDGLTATANIAGLSQKPAVGDVVIIRGTADNNTIKADGIQILPKAS
jgi:hypothetical protein